MANQSLFLLLIGLQHPNPLLLRSNYSVHLLSVISGLFLTPITKHRGARSGIRAYGTLAVGGLIIAA